MIKHISRVLGQTSLLALAVGSALPASAQGTQTPQPTVEELAQSEDQAPSEVTDEGDILVTGTLIRGIKPVGSNVISQDREQIESLGVTDTRQVIAQLPQSNSFMGIPQPGNGVIGQGTVRVPVTRATLRNIPQVNGGSGQPTLVLIDGHRVVPAGLEQQVVDLAIVPKGILERTEIILDGASAVYGSDAVAGVINLITRKRFSGTEISSSFGIADNYWQVEAGVTQGFTWGTGGVTLNYDFAKNTNIFNFERDYTKPLNYVDFPTPQVDDAACPIPNVRAASVTGQFYTHRVQGAGLAAGPQYCNGSAFTTLVPSEELHSGFLTFSQDIGDRLKFEVSALYSHKVQEANTGPFTAVSTVTSTNPYYRCDLTVTPTCTGAAATQTVASDFSAIFGNEAGVSRTKIATWQVNPELTADLGGGWQARLSGAYGRSHLTVHQDRLDPILVRTLAAGTTTATAINPYDLAATQNSALFGPLLRTVDNYSKFMFSQARIAADGPLFSLPGGDVRLAIGAEWMRTTVEKQVQDENFFTFAPVAFGSSTSKAVFAEIVAPLVGPDNAMPGLQSLVFSASGRYDKYDRFDNFSPKLALTYKPLDWVTIRANWGKSFRAPNAIDALGASGALIRNVGATQNPTNVNPAYNFSSNSTQFRFLFLTGTADNLQPETSTNWSIGTDISPPFIPGLTLSATYWNIDFKNTISFPVSGVLVTPTFLDPSPNNLSAICYAPGAPAIGGQTVSPTCSAAQIAAFIAAAPSGPGALASITAPQTIAALVDSRVRNLGGSKVSGVDLSARYFTDTSFGSIDAMVNVAIPITVESQFFVGSAFIDEQLTGDPDWTLAATVGANIGDFRAQTTVRHRSGFVAEPNAANPRVPGTEWIPSFTLVDLGLRYDVGGDSWLTKGLRLSLNVNNVFDAHPPFDFTRNGGVVTGASTLGRMFVFGITKRFGGDVDGEAPAPAPVAPPSAPEPAYVPPPPPEPLPPAPPPPAARLGERG